MLREGLLRECTDLAQQARRVDNLPSFNNLAMAHGGKESLIDGEAPSIGDDAPEVSFKCSGHHRPGCDSGSTGDDFLYVVANIRHSGQRVPPYGLFGFTAFGGKPHRSVHNDVRMK